MKKNKKKAKLSLNPQTISDYDGAAGRAAAAIVGDSCCGHCDPGGPDNGASAGTVCGTCCSICV